jgi:hypothetical protein
LEPKWWKLNKDESLSPREKKGNGWRRRLLFRVRVLNPTRTCIETSKAKALKFFSSGIAVSPGVPKRLSMKVFGPACKSKKDIFLQTKKKGGESGERSLGK